jgi:hypothetical protein
MSGIFVILTVLAFDMPAITFCCLLDKLIFVGLTIQLIVLLRQYIAAKGVE